MSKNNFKTSFSKLFFVACVIFWISVAQGFTKEKTDRRDSRFLSSKPMQQTILALAQGECLQNRETLAAPEKFLSMANPLPLTEESINKAEALYQNQARPIACKVCHGINGDGKGDPDFESNPPARNFSCTETMKRLSDGQLFWIIKNGSPNTSMFAFSDLSNDQIWQLIHYIRRFSK